MEKAKSKKYALKKTEQKEFDGLPPKDSLVIAAENYLCAIRELQLLKDQVDLDREKLVLAFREDGRDKLRIEGKWVSYQHVVKDQIKVETPKG